MNTDIPTPECDAAECEAHIGVTFFDESHIAKAFNFARSLERRLAVAVDALRFYADSTTLTGYGHKARTALAQIERMKHE